MNVDTNYVAVSMLYSGSGLLIGYILGKMEVHLFHRGNRKG